MPDIDPAVELRLKRLEEDSDRNRDSHSRMFAKLEEMESNHKVTSNELDNIKEMLQEIKTDVKDLKEKPTKRYERLTESVIQWVIIAVLVASNIFK